MACTASLDFLVLHMSFLLKIGIGIQHALELTHHIGVELLDYLLLRGRVGRRHVIDDGGHFLWRTAPTKAAEQLGYSHHCLATWPENKKARYPFGAGFDLLSGQGRTGVYALRRRATTPSRPKPARNMPYVSGSGTADTVCLMS